MRTPFSLAVLAVVATATGAVAPVVRASSSGPEYASQKSREIIQKMVEAHGGIDRWRSSPTVSFHAHLKVDFGDGNWIPFWEETTVETRSRRVYSKLPNADGTSGRLAYDGQQAWSAGTLRGLGRAPAKLTAWRDFYLYNLPWMTQDAGVQLGEPGVGKLPKQTEECHVIPMTFAVGTGHTPRDTYKLYIDKNTYQLRGAEYVMTYSALMQGGAKASPASTFVWDETTTVDGLLVPANYTVYWSKDQSVVVKDGTVTDWSFSTAFDESQLEMPADGKVDQSTP